MRRMFDGVVDIGPTVAGRDRGLEQVDRRQRPVDRLERRRRSSQGHRRPRGRDGHGEALAAGTGAASRRRASRRSG